MLQNILKSLSASTHSLKSNNQVWLPSMLLIWHIHPYFQIFVTVKLLSQCTFLLSESYQLSLKASSSTRGTLIHNEWDLYTSEPSASVLCKVIYLRTWSPIFWVGRKTTWPLLQNLSSSTNDCDPGESDLFTANQCSLQFLHHLSTVIKDSRKTRFYLQKSFQLIYVPHAYKFSYFVTSMGIYPEILSD